jgi:hypothetical protein
VADILEMVHPCTSKHPIPNPPGMHKYVVDPVAAFDKSIKCNPKDFHVILDIKD